MTPVINCAKINGVLDSTESIISKPPCFKRCDMALSSLFTGACSAFSEKIPKKLNPSSSSFCAGAFSLPSIASLMESSCSVMCWVSSGTSLAHFCAGSASSAPRNVNGAIKVATKKKADTVRGICKRCRPATNGLKRRAINDVTTTGISKLWVKYSVYKTPRKSNQTTGSVFFTLD